jgi:hypothetical protein
MTTSFPETKTGLRFGLAALAATGCLAAVLAAGLPVRAQDNPVLAKVNGVENINLNSGVSYWARAIRVSSWSSCSTSAGLAILSRRSYI